MKIYKCVSAAELEFCTMNGWALDQILNQDKTVNVRHTAPAHVAVNNQNTYGGVPTTIEVQSPVLVREPLFLLWKATESENREAELTRLLNAEIDGHKGDNALYDKVCKERDGLKREVDDHFKELNKAAAQQIKDIEAKRKLEGDLAKVQRAIGDLKYFEIVGGPVKAS